VDAADVFPVVDDAADGLLPDIGHCTACGEALRAGEASFNTLGDGLFCPVHRNGSSSDLSADSCSWRSACCERRLRPLPPKPGLAAADRTCAASPFRPWSGIWSANCARLRLWRASAPDRG